MAEKMYSFTHSISETKLLALISQHSDEVRIDIINTPQRKTRKQLNGTPAPLMLTGPSPEQSQKTAKQHGVGRGNYKRKRGVAHALLWPELVKGEPLTSASCGQLLKDNRFKPASAYNVFSRWIKQGLARRLSEGVYQITKKGVELHAKQTATASTN